MHPRSRDPALPPPSRRHRRTHSDDSPAANARAHSTRHRLPPLQPGPSPPQQAPAVLHTEGTRQLSHRADRAAPSLCLALPGPVPPQPAPGSPRRPVPQCAPADKDPPARCPWRSSPAPAPRGGDWDGRREGGPRSCRHRDSPPGTGGKAGWGTGVTGGAGRAAAPGAVPGGSPWRPGLAGCGCPSYSRRGTWIKGSSGTWQGQTTSSSSAPTGTGCSSTASSATVSSGKGRGVTPSRCLLSPWQRRRRRHATRPARLRAPHTRSGRNARRHGSGARPAGFAETRRGVARSRALPPTLSPITGRAGPWRGRVRPRGAAFEPERGPAAAARPYR